jgi:integrase
MSSAATALEAASSPPLAWTAARSLVLDSLASPLSRLMYAKALDDFFAWWDAAGCPALTRAVIHAHRVWLESREYSPSTVNQRLAALRKLAREASAQGWMPAETAASILSVPGAKQSGTRAGQWLTREQAQLLLELPDASTLKGKRDRAALALLLGCGLRRAELTGLRVEDIDQRDSRWAIPDLRGKHGRLRTVPVPEWVKRALDAWLLAAGIDSGSVLRAINRGGAISRSALTPHAILLLVRHYGTKLGVKLRPHDARRTCAKLCRAAGGDLEQIQLLLGHASIQTTERYLGTRQDLRRAPNDGLGLKI